MLESSYSYKPSSPWQFALQLIDHIILPSRKVTTGLLWSETLESHWHIEPSRLLLLKKTGGDTLLQLKKISIR